MWLSRDFVDVEQVIKMQVRSLAAVFHTLDPEAAVPLSTKFRYSSQEIRPLGHVRLHELWADEPTTENLS
jgi:hypothetical protein